MAGSIPTFENERMFHTCGYPAVAGIDEAGRGALAGPLVAGCVVLDEMGYQALVGIVNDSKVMRPAKRVTAYSEIVAVARGVGIGFVDAREIDRHGIAASNRIALERAVAALPFEPDAILGDAFLIDHDAPQIALIDGDARSVTIAAASILAKVSRDRYMMEMGGRFSVYGFPKHFGYGTPQHLAALRKHGPCYDHRLTFAPVRSCLAGRAS